MKIEPLGIQHTEEAVCIRRPTQLDHGVGHALAVEALQVVGDTPQRDGNLPSVQFCEGQQRLQKRKDLLAALKYRRAGHLRCTDAAGGSTHLRVLAQLRNYR